MPLNRRRAREVALQVLYADDLNPQRDLTEADEFLCRRLRDVDGLVEFARGIVSGVRRCRLEIDAALSRQASNWSLDRMAAIDRNLLRLGVFELLHTETPPPVVLNEVIELAKRFGGRQSHQFVNGVLDKLVPPQRAAANRRSASRKPGQGAAAGAAASAAGDASRGGPAPGSAARSGVISRYGLTVRPRTKTLEGANTAGQSTASGTADAKTPGMKAGQPKSSEAKVGESNADTSAAAGLKSFEPNASEANSGEAKTGEAKTGEARTGEAKTGEAKTGEARTGEAKAGEAKTGEAKTGEANSSGGEQLAH